MAWKRVRLLVVFCAFIAIASATSVLAGPPFVTDDPEPVDLGHWEIYAFSAGANGRGDTTGLGPSLEVNYGAAPNLQLHFIGGFAYDDQPGGRLQMGMSDTELGAKYRFISSGPGDWWPQIGIFPLVEIPTGDAKRALGAGYWQEFLPLWVQKDFDKWTTYGGGGYWINPGPGNRNYWFFGWLLQRQVTESLVLGSEVFHQTSSAAGRNASTGFNFGGIYDFTEHDHLLFSVGRGGLLFAVDTAAVGYPSTYYVAFQWTF